MSVTDLSQERLVRAMVATAAAAASGDPNQVTEKAEVLKKVLESTDESTIEKVLRSNKPSFEEVAGGIVSFVKAASDLGRLIEKIRGI